MAYIVEPSFCTHFPRGILIQIPLEFVCECPIDNEAAWVEVMECCMRFLA